MQVDEKELEDKGPPQPEGQSQKDQLKGMAKEFNKVCTPGQTCCQYINAMLHTCPQY